MEIQYILLIFGILLVLTVIVKIIEATKGSNASRKMQAGPSQPAVSMINYAFERKRYIMSPAELKFFKELQTASDNNWQIFSKVRLEDIISVKDGLDKKEAFALRNRIKSRHIDFVVCDKDTMEIQVCVELDDSTHQQKKRIQRDDFVNQALSSAGVRIERIPVKSFYSQAYIKENILPEVIAFSQETEKQVQTKRQPHPDEAYMPPQYRTQ